MSIIFAMMVALVATSLIVILSVMFSMIYGRNQTLAAQFSKAQGSLENIQRGQMVYPNLPDEHLITGGLAWNENEQKHERQSAISGEALKSVFLYK